MSDYSIEFRTLAASCGWNGEAQFDVFFNGLSDSIKDELITQESPESFDALVDLAIRVDTRLQQRNKWRLSRGPRKAPTGGSVALRALPALQPAPASTPDPEPMQINRYHLSATEKQRRINSNCCLYCGEAGHYASSCPAKGEAHL